MQKKHVVAAFVAFFLLCLGVGVGLYFTFAPRADAGADAVAVPVPDATAAPGDVKYPAFVLTKPPTAVGFARGATLVPVTSQAPSAQPTVWWAYKGATEHGSVGLVPDPSAKKWLLVAFGAKDATGRELPCTVWAVGGSSLTRVPPTAPGVWFFASTAKPVPLPTMRLEAAPAVAPTPQQLPSCIPAVPCAGVADGACAAGTTCYMENSVNAACIAAGTLGSVTGGSTSQNEISDPAITETGDATSVPVPAHVPCAGVATGACAEGMTCYMGGTEKAACIAAGTLGSAAGGASSQNDPAAITERDATPVPVPAPVPCAGVAGGTCAAGMTCYMGNTVNAACIAAGTLGSARTDPAITERDAAPVPVPAPVSCAGVAGGACAWNMECYAAGTPQAACVVPGSRGSPTPTTATTQPTTGLAPGLVLSGLVVHIEPASYPGSGSIAVPNLASPSAPATLRGKCEPMTVADKRAIHIVNTGGPRENKASMELPEVEVRTVSFWFYVTFRTEGMVFLFDGRTSGSSKVGEGVYVVPEPLQVGEKVEGAVAYLNGSAAQPLSDVMAPLLALSSSWQHLTIVLKDPVRSALKMFGRHSYDEGMDVCVGRTLVYDRALTEAESRAIYSASF